MNQALDQVDERIGVAEEDVAQAIAVIGVARGLRRRLEEERQRARGELAKGNSAATVDLDRLSGEIIAARRAEQDADKAVVVAREKVLPLQQERAQAEKAEVAAALAPLLDVQGALALQVDAATDALATVIRLYRAGDEEANRLGMLLGVSGFPPGTADVRVARRLMAACYTSLKALFDYAVTWRLQRVAESDSERATTLRAAVDRVLPRTTPPASVGRARQGSNEDTATAQRTPAGVSVAR